MADRCTRLFLYDTVSNSVMIVHRGPLMCRIVNAQMRKDTDLHSQSNPSLYSRCYCAGAAVIITIILIQFRKTNHRSLLQSLFLRAAAPELRTMQPSTEEGKRGCIYLHPPCQLPAFMPTGCVCRVLFRYNVAVHRRLSRQR